jgi:hypothetical protein
MISDEQGLSAAVEQTNRLLRHGWDKPIFEAKVARKALEQGIADLMQVRPDALPNAKLRRIHQATVTGEPWHDAAAIRKETEAWAFPRVFLDFETIQLGVPRWIGTRPFSQVPFQFSAHIQTADGSLSHTEYLSVDGSDPRRGCAEALATLPQTGAVIAWNMAFKRSCLLGLAPGRSSRRSAANRTPALLPPPRHARQLVDQGGAANARSGRVRWSRGPVRNRCAGVVHGSAGV